MRDSVPPHQPDYQQIRSWKVVPLQRKAFLTQSGDILHEVGVEQNILVTLCDYLLLTTYQLLLTT